MALFGLRGKTQVVEGDEEKWRTTKASAATKVSTVPGLAHPAPAASKDTSENSAPDGKDAGDVLVSVVIPVFNSMPYLTELLNSLESQDLDKNLFEVIAVNDGSTDFGGEILDVYAKRNANFFVVHQENSGWPGKPRNVGIDRARGQYVFFVDGDDRLGAQALRRMTAFAQAHDVDVLVPKMVGIDGRRAPVKLFERTIRDVSYDFILCTLSPQKMIRKTLLDSHNIRFDEDKVRLEDGMAMVQAYSVARRISILADYNYYEIRRRSDGQNISTRQIEAAGYVASLSKIAQTVKEHAGADLAMSRMQIAGLFKRKGLSFYTGQRFLMFDEQTRFAWIQNHQNFLRRFDLADSPCLFRGQDALRVSAILNSDVDTLKRLAEHDVQAQRPPEVMSIDVTHDSVRLSIDFPADGPKPASALIVDRDEGGRVRAEVSIDSNAARLTSEFQRELILSSVGRLGDIFLAYVDGSTKRIKMGQGVSEVTQAGIRVYETGNGFLSVDRRKA